MTGKTKKFSKKTAKLKWQILSATVDLLSLNAAIILAFLIRFSGNIPSFNFNAYLNLAAYITLFFFLIYYTHDLYDVERYFDWSGTAARIFQANFIGILTVISLSFVLRVFSFPRSVFVISYFTASLIVIFNRYLVTRFFSLELPVEEIFIVGEDEALKKIELEIKEKSHLGFRFAGSVAVSDEPDEQTFNEILKKIKKIKPDRVIFALKNHSKEFLFKLSESLPEGLRIQIVPGIYESLFGRLNFETLADIPLMDIGMPPETAWTRFGKRVFDIVVSFILLLLLFPLFLIVAAAIKLDSSGPVFYRQKRVGLKGAEFWCYKFRTMVKDAEKLSGPVLATENDPRITRVGKILRRYRLDEFPQLINILKGDMSLVGPRPERPEFVSEFEKKIPFYRYRFLVRPGATGLAQIYGKYETGAFDKLKYDLIYIFNVSFFLDMLILLRTFNTIFTGKGAR